MKTKIKFRIYVPFFLVLFILGNQQIATRLFSESRWKDETLPAGNITVPVKRTIQWKEHSEYADSLFSSWKDEAPENWSFDKKMDLPRTLLAHLLANYHIPEQNQLILSLKPWGKPGSKWLLNPNGGYDFPETAFITILYLFDDRPQILFPEAKKYLVEIMLNDEGKWFSGAVPGTLGRIMDSENHILMAQGSKYLKNRYLMLHGNKEDKYDNEHNGMENGILNKLNELTNIGLYEFNSVPYLGYTLAALLNLEAFGSEKVRNASRDVLDFLCFNYALGSYDLKYYPPFRRRYEQAKNTSLSKDYQTVYMKTWLTFHPTLAFSRPSETGKSHALIAACMPYRPTDEVVDLIFNKSRGYFVKLGHGSEGSPEIYSAGPGYLLSAGGVNRGKWSNIVARPVCLFLKDDANEITEIFHIKGKGNDYMKWNNTGVYQNFACTNGAVFVPEKFKPAATYKLWAVYAIGDSLAIAVHSSEGLGIISVFKNQKPTELADQLLKSNPDPGILNSHFQFPGGQAIDYDVNSPKDKWVIKAVDGKQTNRDFGKWPLIEKL